MVLLSGMEKSLEVMAAVNRENEKSTHEFSLKCIFVEERLDILLKTLMDGQDIIGKEFEYFVSSSFSSSPHFHLVQFFFYLSFISWFFFFFLFFCFSLVLLFLQFFFLFLSVFIHLVPCSFFLFFSLVFSFFFLTSNFFISYEELFFSNRMNSEDCKASKATIYFQWITLLEHLEQTIDLVLKTEKKEHKGKKGAGIREHFCFSLCGGFSKMKRTERDKTKKDTSEERKKTSFLFF